MTEFVGVRLCIVDSGSFIDLPLIYTFYLGIRKDTGKIGPAEHTNLSY